MNRITIKFGTELKPTKHIVVNHNFTPYGPPNIFCLLYKMGHPISSGGLLFEYVSLIDLQFNKVHLIAIVFSLRLERRLPMPIIKRKS